MDTDTLTCDKFLDGRLHIWQPRSGYRAATDPVLLASAVDATPGQSVLDIGCGVGVISLCLGARVNDLSLYGLELQGSYASLARRNAEDNGIAMRVFEGDLSAMPPEIKERRFDHVVSNPPFFDAASSSAPQDPGKHVAHMGTGLRLADWIRACLKRVAPKGSLTVIQRAEFLPDLLSALGPSCGDIEVFPIAAREGRAAGRVIVSARSGTRGAFVLHPPLVMHSGRHHREDGDDFTEVSKSILRHGATLRTCVTLRT